MEKTCGNCGMFALEPFKQRGGACMGSFDRDTCTYHSTSIHRSEDNCYWCSGWIPKQDPIEQSYQQLAEVAKDMFTYINDPLDFVERIGEKYILDGHYKWSSIFVNSSKS